MGGGDGSFLKDLSHGADTRASAALDAVLKTTKNPLQSTEPVSPVLSKTTSPEPPLKEAGESERPLVETLSHALKDSPVIVQRTERSTLRLLIFTKDASLISLGSHTQKRMLELSELFAELHCVVLTTKEAGIQEVSRISNTVWVYSTNSTYWWQSIFDARHIALEQLDFGGGFRADIVLSEDPFESGVAGFFIARKFNRPFQIHVFDNFYDPGFRYEDTYNNLRTFVAHLLIPRADCIRTRSRHLLERLTNDFKKRKDRMELLPLYYDLDAWKSAEPSFTLRERYPMFRFFLFHVSGMTSLSKTEDVIAGTARLLLQYPAVALVIVGDGPRYSALKRQVAMLKLQRQVIFEGMSRDLTPHFKTAHIYLHFSEDTEEEYLLLRAAASRIPIVGSMSGIGNELFLDGESAFLCPSGDTQCISEKIYRLFTDEPLRFQYRDLGDQIVFRSVEQDYATYLEAYRESIERCVLLGSYRKT
jgi:glycosyltransferase involved in cell wall biosynthesis